MISSISERIVADLRRAWLLLAVVAVGGAVAGGVVAASRPVVHEASARVLVLPSAGKPFTPDDLRTLIDAPVLAAAAAKSGLPEGVLAGGMAIRGRPEIGLFDLAFVHGDHLAATRGADALAQALTERIGELGRVRRELVLATELEANAHERQAAEAAYLAHLEAVGDAEPGPLGGSTLKGAQRAERERLKRALVRAEGQERAQRELDLRYRVDLAWNSPRASVVRGAGPAFAIAPPSAKRGAVSGGAIGLLVGVAGVLLFGAGRRHHPAPTPDAGATGT